MSDHSLKSGHPAPFHSILADLLARQEAPGAATLRARRAPPMAPQEAAPAIAAVCPIAATAELYVDPEATDAASPTARSIAEAVALELQLSEGLGLAELERMRRTFAYRNHPDRVGPALKARALERMTVANALIDEALEVARARAICSSSRQEQPR